MKMGHQSIAIAICDQQCHPKGRLDYRNLSERLLKNSLFKEVVILEKACRDRNGKLDGLKGKKVLFGGCPFLEESGLYEKTFQDLCLKKADFFTVDIKTEIFDLYEGKENIEENLYRKLVASGNILARREPFEEDIIKPDQKALVYGSGFSGLKAALRLAAESIPVDIVETHGASLSPGYLSMILAEPGMITGLLEAARKAETITLLPQKALKEVTPGEGGFIFRKAGGEKQEYGTIIFAPEREERPAGEIGALNLTQLYARIGSQEALKTGAWKGETVFILDHKTETGPEIFSDAIKAAEYLRKMHCAEVKILLRNARVSIPGLQELYDDCRQAGIIFIKYEDSLYIKNSGSGFAITGVDLQTSGQFIIKDTAGLIIPGKTILSPQAREFARSLNLRIYNDDYSQSDSLWRLPNESNRPGIFVAGAAKGNMDKRAVEEDAESLVFSLRQRLSPAGLRVEEYIPQVDKDKCALCMTCMRVCPFGAMVKDALYRVAKALKSTCRACGTCAAECPAKAIRIRNLEYESLISGMRALA